MSTKNGTSEMASFLLSLRGLLITSGPDEWMTVREARRTQRRTRLSCDCVTSQRVIARDFQLRLSRITNVLRNSSGQTPAHECAISGCLTFGLRMGGDAARPYAPLGSR